MTTKISKEEAERQKFFTTTNKLFELGKIHQQNEILKNIESNKNSIKKKLLDEFNCPKIKDSLFQYDDKVNIVLEQISDDKVNFACNNMETYNIYAGSQSIENINDFEGKIESNSLYIVIDNWKSYPNDTNNYTKKIFFRNIKSKNTISNSYTNELQPQQDEIYSKNNKFLLKLDKPLLLPDLEASNYIMIKLKSIPLAVNKINIKKLILIRYFLDNDIKKLNNVITEKNNEIKHLDKLCDEQTEDLLRNESFIKSKQFYIQELETKFKNEIFKYNLIFSLLICINLITLYSAMFGYNRLISDSSNYIFYPTYYIFNSIFLNVPVLSFLFTIFIMKISSLIFCKK